MKTTALLTALLVASVARGAEPPISTLASKAREAASGARGGSPRGFLHACYESSLCARDCQPTLEWIVAQRPAQASYYHLEGLTKAPPPYCADARALRGKSLAEHERWAQARMLATMKANRARSTGEAHELLECAFEWLAAGGLGPMCVTVEPKLAARGLHEILDDRIIWDMKYKLIYKFCDELATCAGRCGEEMVAMSAADPVLPRASRCELGLAPHKGESAADWQDRATKPLVERIGEFLVSVGPRLPLEMRLAYECDVHEFLNRSHSRAANCPARTPGTNAPEKP